MHFKWVDTILTDNIGGCGYAVIDRSIDEETIRMIAHNCVFVSRDNVELI